jgi:hypothetical protein
MSIHIRRVGFGGLDGEKERGNDYEDKKFEQYIFLKHVNLKPFNSKNTKRANVTIYFVREHSRNSR